MRGLRLPALTACLIIGLLALASTAGAGDDPYAALLAPTGTCGAAADQLNLDATTAQLAMQCLTNFARAKQSLPPLRLSTTLNTAGRAKLTSDLSCGEFSHTPCGRPFENVFATYLKGAANYQIGENIAWGTGSLGTPRQTMSGWLHSTGHRANILTAAFAELGIGYLPAQRFQGYSGATLWSQEFGLRSPRVTSNATMVAKRKPRKHH
jgi:uncharacterized protein YkwD